MPDHSGGGVSIFGVPVTGADPTDYAIRFLRHLFSKWGQKSEFPKFEELPPEQQSEILSNRIWQELDTERGQGVGGEDSEGSMFDSPERLKAMYDYIVDISGRAQDIGDFANNPLLKNVFDTNPQQGFIDSSITGQSDTFYDAVGIAEDNPVELEQKDVFDIMARVANGENAAEVLNEYGVYVDADTLDFEAGTDAGGALERRVRILTESTTPEGGGATPASGGSSTPTSGGTIEPNPDDPLQVRYEDGQFVFNDGTRVPAKGQYVEGGRYRVMQNQQGEWYGEHTVGEPDTPSGPLWKPPVNVLPLPGQSPTPTPSVAQGPSTGPTGPSTIVGPGNVVPPGIGVGNVPGSTVGDSKDDGFENLKTALAFGLLGGAFKVPELWKFEEKQLETPYTGILAPIRSRSPFRNRRY